MNMKESRKKYTLVLHKYIGSGWYMVDVKRVRCTESRLDWYQTHEDCHFVLNGWPRVSKVVEGQLVPFKV